MRNVFRKLLTGMVHGVNRLTWLFFPKGRVNYTNKIVLHAANVVMAPILWIMRAFISAQLAVLVDGETVTEHEMLDLIRRPNPYYSGTILLMATILSYFLDGNAYWIVVRRERDLKPIQLWYIPHWMIEPYAEFGSENYIDYYRYTPDGKEIKLETPDVIHIRYGIDPENVRKGLAPLKSAFREIFTDEEAGQFAATILVNQGVPGVVVSPDGDYDIPPQDVDDVKKYVAENTTGRNRGEPLVLSGPTKVTEFGWSPEKINLSGLRNLSEERVTALIGVPAAVVGFGTGVQQTKVGATLKELRSSAWEDTIIPLGAVICEELHTQLLPDFEPNPDAVRVTLDTSGVPALQEDKGKRIERLNNAVQGGWLTVAHAQAMAGWEVDESQDVYLRRMTFIEAPAGSAPRQSEAEKRLKMRKINRSARNRLAALLMRDEKRLSTIFSGELEERFGDYGEKAAAIYDELQKSVAAPTKDVEDEILAQKITDELEVQTEAAVVLGYVPHYLRTARKTIEGINAVLELGVNMSDPIERAVVDAGGKRMGLIDLSAQSRKALFEALSEARAEGYGGEQLSRLIKDKVAAGPWTSARVRAEVIARTETKFAQNTASVEVGRESGATAMEVVDAQLGPTDDFCEWIDGRLVSVADAEALAASEHPNGTRSFIPVFDPDAAERIESGASLVEG